MIPNASATGDSEPAVGNEKEDDADIHTYDGASAAMLQRRAAGEEEHKRAAVI